MGDNLHHPAPAFENLAHPDVSAVVDRLISEVPEADRHLVTPDTRLRELLALGQPAHVAVHENGYFEDDGPFTKVLALSPKLGVLLFDAKRDSYLEETLVRGRKEDMDVAVTLFEEIDERFSVSAIRESLRPRRVTVAQKFAAKVLSLKRAIF